MKYQQVRIKHVLLNKTKITLKDFVIVARPYDVPAIPSGIVKINLSKHDGEIQKDAWYLIEHTEYKQ